MSCELNNVYDICVLQNQTFNLILTFENDDGTPKDLTHWSFTGSIKQKFSDRAPTMFITSSVISAASGTLRLYISADDTWMLTSPRYFYDLISNDSSASPPETLRLMQGKVVVKSGVTEP
jgi:hypothetical protein